MPPAERPSTGVGTERGVSDPAHALCTRPQSRPAGSLTPHVGVEDVLGRAPCAWEYCPRIRTDVSAKFSPGTNGETASLLPWFPQALRFKFRGVIASWFAVAPVPHFSGALGRVKGPLRRCAPLTRPARSLIRPTSERQEPSPVHSIEVSGPVMRSFVRILFSSRPPFKPRSSRVQRSSCIAGDAHVEAGAWQTQSRGKKQ